jgi:hypothetical protein
MTAVTHKISNIMYSILRRLTSHQVAGLGQYSDSSWLSSVYDGYGRNLLPGR